MLNRLIFVFSVNFDIQAIAKGCVQTAPFIFAALILIAVYAKRVGARFNVRKFILVFLLSMYTVAVFTATDIPDIRELIFAPYECRPNELYLDPLRMFKHDRSSYLLNIVLFIPYGILLPAFGNKFGNPLRLGSTAALISLTIELCQLKNRRTTDVCDLMTNVLGALAGLILFRVLESIFSSRRSKNMENGESFILKYEAEIILVLTFLVYISLQLIY